MHNFYCSFHSGNDPITFNVGLPALWEKRKMGRWTDVDLKIFQESVSHPGASADFALQRLFGGNGPVKSSSELVHNCTLSTSPTASPRTLEHSPPPPPLYCEADWSQSNSKLRMDGVFWRPFTVCSLGQHCDSQLPRHKAFGGKTLVGGVWAGGGRGGEGMAFVNKRITSPGSERGTPCHRQTVCSSLGQAMPAPSNAGYMPLFPSYEPLKVSPWTPQGWPT